MPYETLLLTIADRVATITLNRPKVLNALNALMLRELDELFATLAADDAIRVILLRGAGGKAFAAGADISELAEVDGSSGEQFAERTHRIFRRVETLGKPVIAVIDGFALGGGCELAMACDFRIASENAKFGQPEVNLGVPPGYGGTQRTTRLLGSGMALYMCLTGEMIDAAEALRVGLVQRVVPIADLLPEALKIAKGIAAKAPLAITATKRAIREGASLPLTQGLALEALHFGAMVTTSDFREGTRAFLDKRKPVFEGR
jgi:enoyl-CoA hydratase